MTRPRAVLPFLLAAAAAAAVLVPARRAGAASPLNMQVVGRAPISGGFADALFVHDGLAFFSLSPGGFSGNGVVQVYDVNDPTSPVRIAQIPTPGRVPDMHGLYYSNGLLYVGYKTPDGGGPSGGLAIWDLAVPASPQPRGVLEITRGVHNLRYADGYVYIMSDSFAEVDVFVIDVRNPDVPVEVNRWETFPGSSFCHDLSIMEGVGYASMWGDADPASIADGLYLLDLSAPPAVNVLSRVEAGLNTHSAWPTADLKSVVTCHERRNEGLKIWDVTQDPHALQSVWQTHETSVDTIVHDAMVVGRYAFVSYYAEGARVLDISDPEAPVEVGSYLTAASPCGGFCSAIAQWVEDGLFYLLDEESGLWILDFTLPHDAPITIRGVKANAGQDASFSWNHTGESQYTLRRRTRKETLAGLVNTDVDAHVRHADAGVVPDGQLYFYTVNGAWR